MIKTSLKTVVYNLLHAYLYTFKAFFVKMSTFRS